MAVAQNQRARVTQVLVHVSTYQGSIRYWFFEPYPNGHFHPQTALGGSPGFQGVGRDFFSAFSGREPRGSEPSGRRSEGSNQIPRNWNLLRGFVLLFCCYAHMPPPLGFQYDSALSTEPSAPGNSYSQRRPLPCTSRWSTSPELSQRLGSTGDRILTGPLNGTGSKPGPCEVPCLYWWEGNKNIWVARLLLSSGKSSCEAKPRLDSSLDLDSAVPELRMFLLVLFGRGIESSCLASRELVV